MYSGKYKTNGADDTDNSPVRNTFYKTDDSRYGKKRSCYIGQKMIFLHSSKLVIADLRKL